jgi:methionyl-tRNA synthetase
VEKREPWRLARAADRAAELDTTLYSLAEGLRVISVLLHPYMPASTARLLGALGRPALELAGARVGADGGGARLAALEPLFPKR